VWVCALNAPGDLSLWMTVSGEKWSMRGCIQGFIEGFHSCVSPVYCP
jgi:hypothetical protein